MGWQSSGDFMQGSHIFFKTKEDAIHFAEKQGMSRYIDPFFFSFSTMRTPRRYADFCRLSVVCSRAKHKGFQSEIVCRKLLALSQETKDHSDQVDRWYQGYCCLGHCRTFVSTGCVHN